MKFRNDLTSEQVRSAVQYEPETGVFTRMFQSGPRVCGSKTDSGHILIYVRGALYKAHRLAWIIMTGEWPDCEIDHINRDPSDNRWENLRSVSRCENVMNRTAFYRKYDLPRGVTKYGTTRCLAQMKYKRKQYTIGIFDTPEEAHAAYIAALGDRARFLPKQENEDVLKLAG